VEDNYELFNHLKNKTMKTTDQKSITMENEQKTEEENYQPDPNLESETVMNKRKTPCVPSRFKFQLKTMLMTKFMKPLEDFMDQLNSVSFKKILNQNVRNCYSCDSPKLQIDYSKLIITQGILPLAPGISVSSPKEGKLLFRWTDDSGIGNSRADDQVFVAIYSRQAKKWVFNLNAGQRSSGYCRIDVKWFNSKRLQAYIGFESSDGIWVSDSFYAGEVNVF
jgi:Family of unknown function (DUF6266)